MAPGHAVFFQAPLGSVNDRSDYAGRDTLLNTCGYYVEFNSNAPLRPAFINAMTPVPAARCRYRLMELVEPSESFSLYGLEAAAGGNGSYHAMTWFSSLIYPTGFSAGGGSRPVSVAAENIVALIILPRLSPGDEKVGNYNDGSLSPSYLYDSTAAAATQSTTDPNLNPKNQLPPVLQVTMVAVDEGSFARFEAAKPPRQTASSRQ